MTDRKISKIEERVMNALDFSQWRDTPGMYYSACWDLVKRGLLEHRVASEHPIHGPHKQQWRLTAAGLKIRVAAATGKTTEEIEYE